MKHVKSISKGLATALLMIAVLLGAALLRLVWAPVSLAFLNSPIETALTEAVPGWTVQVDDTVLTWREDGVSLGVRLDGVVIASLETGSRFSLPSVDIDLRRRSLVQGLVRPKRIEVAGSDLLVRWSAADLGVGVTDATDQPGPATADDTDAEVRGTATLALINQLIESDTQDGPLAFMQRFTIRDATLRLVEDTTGTVWTAPGATFEIHRHDTRVDLSISCQLDTEGQATSLDVTGRVDRTTGQRVLSIAVADARPSDLVTGMAGAAAAAAGFDMPVSVQLDAQGTRDQLLSQASFVVEAGPGTVQLDGFYPEARAFDGGLLRGQYRPGDGLLVIDELKARFADNTLAGQGQVVLSDDGSAPGVDIDATMGPIALRDVVAYWPPTLAQGGRRWIDANMPAGDIVQATLTLDVAPQMWALGRLPEDAFSLDFTYRGVTAHFLRPMPPVIDGVGRARLTDNALDLKIDEGTVDGVGVPGSSVYLDGLALPKGQTGHVTLRIDAPVADVLRLIDYEPLGYATAFGIAPDDVAGAAHTVGELRFPLESDIGLDEVEFSVMSRLQRVAISGLLAGDGLTDGTLEMRVDKAGIETVGIVSLNGLMTSFHWTESFADEPPGGLPSTYRLEGDLDLADLETMGFGLGNLATGRGRMAVTLRGRGPEVGRGTVSLTFDQDAPFALPLLNWAKPVDTIAELGFGFAAGQNGIAFSDIRATGQGLDIAATASLGSAGDLVDLALERVRAGENDFSVQLVRDPDGRVNAALFGASVDLRPILNGDMADEGEGDGPDADTAAETPAEEAGTALSVRITTDRAVGANGVIFSDVEAAALNDGRFWRQAELAARVDETAELTGRLEPTDTGRQLTLTATDAGLAARGLGLFAHLEGGALTIEAGFSAAGEPLAGDGRLDIRDFRLVRSETLGEVLDAGAVEGVDEFVDADGLRFNRLSLPFHLENGVVDIEGARANGPSIGFTLEGQVDQAFTQVNVNGIIVPAYRYNALLGRIPLLGALITGGSGKGLFALTYRIEGAADDPEVSVNALTAFLPGIFRGPFEGRKGRLDDIEPVPDDPGAPQPTDEPAPPAEEAEQTPPTAAPRSEAINRGG